MNWSFIRFSYHQAGKRLADHFGSSNCPDFTFMRMRGAATASTASSNSTASFQVFALQEELSDVKERSIQLTAR